MKGAALSSDGIPVAFEVQGTGTPALVFVHGWSCDRSYWSQQSDTLVCAISNEPAMLAGLRELEMPIVAINSVHRPTNVDSLQRHGVRTVLMPGVGHFLMQEDADTFNPPAAGDR